MGFPRALVYLAACLLQGCAYVGGSVLHLVLQVLVKLNGKVSCDFVIHGKQRPDISAGARIQHGWSPTIDKVAGMFLFSYIACVEEEEGLAQGGSLCHGAPRLHIQHTIFQKDFEFVIDCVQRPMACEMHDTLWWIVQERFHRMRQFPLTAL